MSQVPGGSARGRGRGSGGALPPARPTDPGGLPAGGLGEVRGGGTGVTGGPAGAVRAAGPAAAGAAAAGAPAAAGAAHAPGKAPPHPGSPSHPQPRPSRPPSQRALSGDGAQEHLSLAQQRLQLDRVRQDLASSPVGLLAKAQGLPASGLSGKWLQKDGTLATGGMCAEGGSRPHPPAVVGRPWGHRLWPSCPPSDTSVPALPLGLCSHRGSCSCSPPVQPAAGRPGPLAPPRQAGAAETHS